MAGRIDSVVVLSGGVGGARFAYGVCRALPEAAVTVIVNTGDDFHHWGLSISPDLDTVMYTLAELADDERGWGLRGDTFQALTAMQRLSGEDWFSLGDRDLATHLRRTAALGSGQTLSRVTAELCQALGVNATLLPMSDLPNATFIKTAAHGTLPFQEWFVKHRAPAVRSVELRGEHVPAPGVIRAVERADVVLVGPSNPYVSIDPILALSGMREVLSQACVVAVSPILGGRAVKGPLAEMIPAITGTPATAGAVARHYGKLLSGFVVEQGDETEIASEGPPHLPHAAARTLPTSILMTTKEDRIRLAREVLAFAETLT